MRQVTYPRQDSGQHLGIWAIESSAREPVSPVAVGADLICRGSSKYVP